MKPIQIALSRLTTKDLFTLGLRVKEILSAKKTDEMGIDFYAKRFVRAFDLYSLAMQKDSVSTEDVQQTDSERDNLWIALRTHIKNYLRHPDATLCNYSKTLLAEMDKHGKNIYNLSYKAETAVLENLIKTFDNKGTELAALYANHWYALLKEKQGEFEAKLRIFTQDLSENQQQDAAYLLRPELVQSIYALFRFLPMQVEMTDNADLKKMVEQLQVEAARF